ncbi:MAG: BatD family protein [Thermodesulfobacteriota bacterium]
MAGRLKLLILGFLLFIPGALHAEDVEVQASVDRTQVAVGESLQLKVSIRGGDGTVDVSSIQDFDIISRGSATNINMINGRFTRENVYTYVLMPLRRGELTIPPLPVQSGGTVVRTQPISVRVTPRSEPDRAEGREVFVEARVSNEAPYEGEQIVYSFRVYQRVQIANPRFQEPAFDGFTAERLEDQRTFTTVVDNREYQVIELNFILLSIGSGVHQIEPAILNCDVIHSGRRRGNFSDPFFGLNRGRFETRRFATEPVTVDVRPLPPYKGDGRFSGLVGTFDIESQIETDELKVGDSATLSILIQGAGNIIDAEEPMISLPDGFKVYKDAPEEMVRLEPTGYTGRKVFRMALVPMNSGVYQLDPVSLVYFDTDREDYVQEFTLPLQLFVAPAEEKDQLAVISPSPPAVTPRKNRVAFTGRDILPLKEDLDALKTRRPMSGGWFLLFLMIPPAVFGLTKTALVLSRKTDSPSQRMAERSEKALREAATNEAAGEAFYGCLYRAVISAVLARADTYGETLTYSEVRSILSNRGYSPEVIGNVLGLLETIESARFGGRIMDGEDRRRLLREIRGLVKSLNK